MKSILKTKAQKCDRLTINGRAEWCYSGTRYSRRGTRYKATTGKKSVLVNRNKIKINVSNINVHMLSFFLILKYAKKHCYAY